MNMVVDPLSWTCLLLGGLFSIVGGIGILRFPDLYTRMHAAGITDTMGAGFVIAGLMLQAGPNLVAVKLALILFFLLMSSPTSAHALARSALAHGVTPVVADDEESRP